MIETIKDDVYMWTCVAIFMLVTGFTFQLGKKMCNKVF